LYEVVGVHDDNEIRDVFRAASRVPAKTLVMDVAAASGDALVRAVHAFRIARPDCKIVVLAGGRETGDETISALVSLGVYNICDGDAEEGLVEAFKGCLHKDASYAAASRWHRGFRDEAPQLTKQTVIIERRPLGTVTLAVAGLAPGVGCTHTALMMGAFLAKAGMTAVVEDAQHLALGSISGLATGKSKASRGFRWGAVDVFPLPKNREHEGWLYDQTAADLTEYDYVVRDLGLLQRDTLRELYRAQLAVVVASASPWRIMDFVRQHNALNEDFAKIAVVSPFGTEQDRKLFKETTGVLPLPIAWCPDPGAIPAASEGVLKRLLGAFLPERKRQKAFGLF